MKKIVLLVVAVLTFSYGQCQQSDNAKSLTSPEISASAVTTAQTFEPEMTTTVIEPKAEATTVKATKLSFKERMMTKLISRQVKKAEANSNANPKAEKTNTIALISGIAALFSLVSLFVGSSVIGTIGLLAAIAAIIMGFVGKGQINDGKGSGKGWAITGIVGGILYFFVILLAVVFIASALSAFVS